MADTKALLTHIDDQLDVARERLFDWLRISSISAQPDHAGDCRRAAEWLMGELAGLGFAASVQETAGGHPVTLGHLPGPSDAPHLLFYGHYDVQPPDPLDLWTSPPFEPILADGPRGKRIVARGAVDDKGQTMLWLEAFRAYRALAGGLPVGVTVLVEGEEEIGSPRLPPSLTPTKELQADVAVIADTGMWTPPRRQSPPDFAAAPMSKSSPRGRQRPPFGCLVALRKTPPTFWRRRSVNCTTRRGASRFPASTTASNRSPGSSLPHGRHSILTRPLSLGEWDCARRRAKKDERPLIGFGPAPQPIHRDVERLHRRWREDRHSRRGECKSPSALCQGKTLAPLWKHFAVSFWSGCRPRARRLST